ncbi:MAG: class I SAM-dependent methyltransferase [Planctomycetota bacterium]
MTSLDDWIRDSEARLRELKIDRPPLAYVCETGAARERSEGLWLEFGTGSGHTTRVMCAGRRHGVVYTFDSFQGLPCDWLPAYGVLRGHFAQPAPVDLPSNASLVVGRFEETIRTFLEERPGVPVDLVHIDCDVYDSAKFVLTQLTERIISGTVLVFDELFYFPGRERHEAKALFEWLTESGRSIEWIGSHGEQSAVDIVEAAMHRPHLKRKYFVGPDRNIIAPDVPVMDRVALLVH